MINVKWLGANYFAHWCGGRLPTHAEWQYALFSSKILENRIPEHEWLKSNSQNNLHKTGESKPHASGLYDLIGNVAEWCSDGAGSQQSLNNDFFICNNPYNKIIDERRVIAGLSYNDNISGCYFGLKDKLSYYKSNEEIGFRVVFNPLLGH